MGFNSGLKGLRFLCSTQLDMHAGRSPMNTQSARRRGLYLHTTQKTQELNIHALRGFEPAIPAIKQFQTYALDCTVTFFFGGGGKIYCKESMNSTVCSTKDDVAVTSD
jgi:hypothetical protein